MSQRLLNKVAVVTGAGGALGRTVVERFLGEGAKVVAFGRNRGRLEELSARAAARVLVVTGDVTRPPDLDGLVATTVRRFGAVDVLVPAAEICRPAALAECAPELVSEVFAVNLQGALETVRLFDRHLNRGASIVFTTTCAKAASLAGTGPFAASKAALASLARTLAVELAPRAIRVNCVAWGMQGSDQVADQAAQAVLFLASDDAAGITGQELVVGTAAAFTRP